MKLTQKVEIIHLLLAVLFILFFLKSHLDSSTCVGLIRKVVKSKVLQSRPLILETISVHLKRDPREDGGVATPTAGFLGVQPLCEVINSTETALPQQVDENITVQYVEADCFPESRRSYCLEVK